MVDVSAGWFEMGRPYADEGFEEELPVHEVYLDAYKIGKYPVTNQEYAHALNWANARGVLTDAKGNAYTAGLVFAYGKNMADTFSSNDHAEITYGDGIFRVRNRTGYNRQNFSMAHHPVVRVSWYGAIAFCNWLSEMNGLEQCYDTTDWTRYEPVRSGYRLPTEAEWERAAAWDAAGGGKHWRYGISSDEISIARANYLGDSVANPLGLTTLPYTSPVGWYDGVNPAQLSNRSVFTKTSASPAGAFDMAGNVWEWCYDWYQADYYAVSPEKNPSGPDSGTFRTLRGGAWNFNHRINRSAIRLRNAPETMLYVYGFRVCISNPS